MTHCKIFIVACIIVLTGFVARGQATFNMSVEQNLFRNAQELYEKQMYSAAQQTFARLLKSPKVQHDKQWQAQIAFYDVACAYELNDDGMERLLREFIAHYPQSEKVNDAHYLLAKYYFRESKYDAAAAEFHAFDAGSLSAVDQPEYYFKYGYALFVLQRFEEASPLFRRIKDSDNRYTSAATYYFAHIAYEQKNYTVAVKAFESLKTDETFAGLVPYYILHIYHQQHDYNKVISEGENFIDNASAKRLPEIARIVGEAYYFKKQYDKALPFIEKFIATAPAVTRSDRYLLGYIYYQNKNYPKAAKWFEQIVVGRDSLAQMAYYYLADAWLHVDDRYAAGRAFAQAAKMDFLPVIKEDAMFNYAKLMFDLNSGPFNDAISALSQYQSAYPKSSHIDEINRYLMQAYVSSHNYKAAWESLRVIKKPDAEVWTAMQRVAYYRAVELFQNQDLPAAIAYLDTSLQHASYNPQYAALALYWKGEALFRQKKYEPSRVMLREFVLSPSIYQSEEYKAAHYGLGYCYFKLNDCEAAQTWFLKFVAINPTSNSSLCDAYNRIGDCYFKQHNYEQAIVHYNKTVANNALDVDYALFQSGLCYGLMRNNEKKIAQMNKVIAYRPTSLYADNAQFEKGRSYVQVQNYTQAIATFQKNLDKPKSAFYSKSLLELGLIYVNLNQQDSALNYYKQVARDYPGTAEARSALSGIRALYIEKGDADAYIQYAGTLQSGGIETSEKDSISFAAAEHAYFSGNQQLAISLLKKYISDFAAGTFLLEVNFYLADAYSRTQQGIEAIPYYEAVLQFPKNDYTEGALDALSALAFGNELYEKASAYYAQLAEIASNSNTLSKAKIGKVQADYFIHDYAKVIEGASNLLKDKNLQKETQRELYYMRAKCYEATAAIDKATADFAIVAQDAKTKEGAEACYKLIEDAFSVGDYAKTESRVIELSRSGTSHLYWIAKSFILLGDAYMARDDAFQAKATYESIVDGYPNTDDGIAAAVKEKLQQLESRENAKDEASQQSQHEITVNS
ncbi:hypothetical protein AGMMS4956_16490 [Bacteroidia bacterium]|nr:hypothetical protein AGMMS4956_16490 [Bacteroidia bacterium]